MGPFEVQRVAIEKARNRMSITAALHNPDLVAGGRDVISGLWGSPGKLSDRRPMENQDTQLKENGRKGTPGVQRLNPHECQIT